MNAAAPMKKKAGPKTSLEVRYALDLMRQPGMTQDRAAKLAGVSQQVVSHHIRKQRLIETMEAQS